MESTNKKTVKNKKVLILIIIAIFALGVVSAIVVPQITVLYDDAQYTKSMIYYGDGLEPKGMGGLIDLMKYTINNNRGEHVFKTSYDDVHKYNDPVWDEFLSLEINKNLNQNYKASFTTYLHGLKLIYKVSANGNIAKVELNATMDGYDGDNLQDIEVINKNYEWYLVLENDIITAYTQNAEGRWIKTEHEPLADGCVAFDIDKMLSELRKLEPIGIPSRNMNSDCPSTREDYGHVFLNLVDPYSSGLGDDPSILVFFSNYPEFQSRLDAVHRYCTPLNQLAKEHQLSGKDTTFDTLCDWNATARSMMLYFESIGGVEVSLPQDIDSAEKVEDFQFIADEILSIAEKYWKN